MADIRLAKPVAGTSQTVVCAPEARFVFDFPTDEAMLSRNGDDLVITFEDGSTLQLENFYTAYSSENMPSFSVDGAEISGQEFFMAMNEPDLMPAAGPTRAVSQGNGNRFHDFADTALLDGLDRLGGLDIGWPGSDVNPETDGAAAGENIDYDVTLSFDSTPGIGNGSLLVSEKDWTANNFPQDSRSMTISAPDGVASIIFGGVTIFENGVLTGNPVTVDGGHFEFDFDTTTGRLNYTFVLDGGAEHNKVLGNDEQLSHDFTVTVIDTDGDSASGEVHLEILDDVPVVSVTGTIGAVESGASSADGKITFDFGADNAAGKSLTVTVDGRQTDLTENVSTTVVGKYGTLTIHSDGTYSYKADTNTAIENTLGGPFSDNVTDKFTFTITDADGDTVSKTLDVTVSPAKAPEVSGSAIALVDEANIVDSEEGNITNVAEVTVTDMFGENSGYKIIGATLPENSGNTVSYEDGKLTYTLKERTEGDKDSTNLSDEESSRQSEDTTAGEIITVTVEDASGNQFTVEVPVNVIDDVPVVTVTSGSTVAGPTENLSGTEGGYDFVTVVTKPDGSLTGQYTNNAQPGGNVGAGILNNVWDGVTIYAGKVTYQGTGNNISVGDLQEDPSGYKLQYSQYGGYWDNNEWKQKGVQDWGIMVTSPGESTTSGNWSAAANFETEADLDENHQPISSEAIIIDLGGKLAYGTTIDFGAFYSNFQDEGMERALLTFYKDGKIVGTRIVEGSNSGSNAEKIVHSEEFLAGGFDKIVISALGNVDSEGNPTGGKDGPQGSSFTIQGIDFITAPEPLYVTEGTVSSVSGADGYDDAFADSHVQFAMDQMFTEVEEGKYTLTVFVNGKEKDASVECQTDDSGNSRLTATVDGEQIFSATLEEQSDGTYAWKMEQYKEFSVADESGGQNDSFQLGFITQDGDGDTAVEYADVPLNTEVIAGESGSDITVSDVDNAGLVVTGDGGDTSVITEGVVTNQTDYNICFLLDISESMDAEIAGQSRYDIAVDAIEQYVNSIITNEKYVGTVNISIIPFASEADPEGFSTIELTILKEEGSTTINGQKYSSEWSMEDAWHDVENLPSGTNYAAAFNAAKKWYDQLDNTDTTENLTYFLTDGFPNKNLDNTNAFDAAKDAYDQYKELINLVSGDNAIKVHAIGIGGGGTEDVLTDEAMQSLSIFDNTGTTDNNPGIIWHNTDGSRAYLIDDKPISVGTYNELQQYLDQHASKTEENTGYFIHVHRDSNSSQVCYYQLTWNEDKGEWGFWEYQDSKTGSLWTSYDTEEGKWTNDKRDFTVVDNEWLVTAAPVTAGESEKIDSADGLNAALAGGLTLVPAFEELTDSVIDASRSESSVNVIYGDVMNTDNLVTAENGAEIGMGYDNFEKLNWSSEDITKYIQDHSEDLGRETLLVATPEDGKYETYYRDVHGDVYRLGEDDAPLDADELKDLTFIGREGGDDTITGSKAGDIIFGQEGNDTIYGGEGADTIYGGTGNDLLYGDGGDDFLFGGAGDDYLDGGEGRDTLYAGSGDDIIVYDGSDYLIDGGDGIDFMVSTDEGLSLDKLLTESGRDGNDGPIVNDVEVLITGKDALSLTNTEQLAKEYGITIGTDTNGDETLTLDMSKWYDKGNGSFDYIGQEDLTLETNLTPVPDTGDAEVQTQVFILNNTQG